VVLVVGAVLLEGVALVVQEFSHLNRGIVDYTDMEMMEAQEDRQEVLVVLVVELAGLV
jgi:hypothetical protein